jgi:UDP-2,3-diacylglucosamine pyrophosphatase LpxH
MKHVWMLLLVMLATLLISCHDSDTDDPETTGIDPFNNGGSERNMIVVLSDIHLGMDMAYAEFNNNRGPLVDLLERIRVSPNVRELVIAGDMFDEWFIPANLNTFGGSDEASFVRRIAANNREVIDAFNRIIAEGKILVTYTPGNHDLAIDAESIEEVLPGINQARDSMQGLGKYTPAGHPEMVIEHGHRYNFFCAPDPLSNQDIAPGTILPPGYFFTRIGTLHLVQNCQTPSDSLPVITPNLSGGESQALAYQYWGFWKWAMSEIPIENRFDEDIIVTNVDGFTGTYSINDLVPYQTTPGGMIDMNLYRGIQDTWEQRQTLNEVPVHIPVSQALTEAALASFTDQQAVTQYFMNPDSNKRIVVFGHSHEAKLISSQNTSGQKTIYANSGTWIDHNPLPTTMNFVVVTPQGTDPATQTYVKVYNFEGEVVTEMASDSVRL